MCGIAGAYGVDCLHRVPTMTRRLEHRGPDDEGVWHSKRAPIAVGNRRLKIVDLSDLGHQPMISDDGRWVLTYNGEIYNHVDLRQALESEGVSFRSRSDTEVVLKALTLWGTSGIDRLQGIFAFALWDDRDHQLLLGRDRLGVKPLYFARSERGFAFASEIRALLAAGLIKPAIDRAALNSFLRLLWLPEPHTLLEGVRKLAPGHLLQFDGESVVEREYWDVPMPGECADDAGAFADLLQTLDHAVTRQMRADVPVGTFLSGGIDSSTIVSLASRATPKPVRSYSIGFRDADRREEGSNDDTRFARIAARAAGSKHHEIIVDPQVTELLPLLVRHLEDPVADPAAINSYLICKAAKESSTVLLSGAGGDELFGGYRKYIGTQVAEGYSRLPRVLTKGLLEPALGRLPIARGAMGFWQIRYLKKFVKAADGTPLQRFLGYSTYYTAAELFSLIGSDVGPEQDDFVGLEPLRDAWLRRDGTDIVDRMMYLDLKFYLPGLALMYTDKASMAASVEVRVPLIDDLVVEKVARMPSRLKVQGFRTKIALRRAVRGVVPATILRRPKAPFSAPIRAWFRGQLREMTADLLSETRLRQRGLVDPDRVGFYVREHRSGMEDHSLRLWALLTLEVWLQEFIDNAAQFQRQWDTDIPATVTTGGQA